MTSPTRRRTSRGAAAVEFALVMPILMLIVFGILQYGLYFFDAHGTRTGVREAARMGVVGSFAGGGCTGDSLNTLACQAAKQIDATTGAEYVKINAASWTRGQPLVVCAYVKSEAIGLLPMPNDGWIFAQTQMSIETEETPPSSLIGTQGSLPPGAPGWPTGC